MTKPAIIRTLTLFSLLLFAACGEKETIIEVQSIAISQPSAEMQIGETLTLKATVSPSNASYDGLNWTSTNPKVASVSTSGLVTALSEGNTTITVMAGGKTASCAITVVKGFVAVTSISLNKASLEMVEGDSESLTATVLPNDATDKTVTWTSSNEAVVTVMYGKVTAVKEGESTVSAKAGDKTASCKVIVKKKVIAVGSIELDKTELIIVEGESETLTATVKPDDATDKSVTWKSANESIATVDNTGKVIAVKEGETTITATAGEMSASCIVAVQTKSQNSVIYYQSHGDKVLNPNSLDAFDAIIISNEYIDGIGVITFDGPITAIGENAFCGQSDLISITIPEGVTSIGEYAFSECLGLTSIVFPGSVNWIKDHSFSGCSNLESISFNEGLKLIGQYAFYNCSRFSSITLPEGLETIAYGAFSHCTNLIKISLPKGLNRISGCAFYECENLIDFALPDGLTWIGERAFYGCSSLTQMEIPRSMEWVECGAFGNCPSIVSFSGQFASSDGRFLICTDSNNNTWLNAVANGAINDNLIVPEEIGFIGDYAFDHCSNLTSIICPEGLNSIGYYSFNACESNIKVALPESLKILGARSFFGCTNLSSFTIPKNVVSVGKEAFTSCKSLPSVFVLPKTPPTGGSYMFYNTSCPIYVPAESVDAYKSAQYWNDYAERIQAIPSVPVPEAVDLDLPSGVKWASFNLGASKPEEYGDYYAWGETEPYYISLNPLIWKDGKEGGYNWPSYKWCMGSSSSTLTKYCNSSSFGYNGFTDNKTILDLEDDAAAANLGGNWRMPTDKEWKELEDNCAWIWTNENGVNGCKVTSKRNGNSIFLPAAQSWANTSINSASPGMYWSSSLYYTDNPVSVSVVKFFRNSVSIYYNFRCFGVPVRPVYAE